MVGQWIWGAVTSTSNRNDPNLIHNAFAPDDFFDLSVKIVKEKEVLFSWQERSLQYNFDEKNFVNRTFTLSREQAFTRPFPKVIVSVNNLNRSAFLINTEDLVVMEEKFVLRKKTNLLNAVDSELEEEKKKNITATKGEKIPHLRERFYAQLIHDVNSYPPN